MEYASGFPALYCLSGDFALEDKNTNSWRKVIKNGSTWYIGNRKSAAITYFPKKPFYINIIILDPKYFKTKDELYKLDEDFRKFCIYKALGKYYIEEEGGVEWFYEDCPIPYVELKIEFLKSRNIPIIHIIDGDPFPIRNLLTQEKTEIEYEIHIINKVAKTNANKNILKTKICDKFLEGKSFRRIQNELFELAYKMCNTDDILRYRGIIQWPTGTGKTIGLLILFMLFNEYYKKMGQVYRCLLISPKNDIFNTIKTSLSKLSEFDIKLYDGSNGKLSSLTIPDNQSFVVFACHQALVTKEAFDILPVLNHIHYDEVHRITGEIFLGLLQNKIKEWNLQLLTGTSATPETANKEQRQKLLELFGDPLPILHKCTVEDAVNEGWIAKPRFIIKILQKTDDKKSIVRGFIDAVISTILEKGTFDKTIIYIETSIEDVKYALEYGKETYSNIQFYGAVDGERTDDDFVKSSVRHIPQILIACQRYLEGSDIRYLENTARLVGDSISAHTMIQVSGRALRIDDNPNKEGWCIIARACEDGVTEEDILDSITLDMLNFMGKSRDKPLTPKDIEKFVKLYIGDGAVNILGHKCSLKETVERIQAAYLRNEFPKRTHKERYTIIREYNKEMNLQNKNEYFERKEEHPKFIDQPEKYFTDYWISWYHFLGIDTSLFPKTKEEFIGKCVSLGLITWNKYKQHKNITLPEEPQQMYPDFKAYSVEFSSYSDSDDE